MGHRPILRIKGIGMAKKKVKGKSRAIVVGHLEKVSFGIFDKYLGYNRLLTPHPFASNGCGTIR